jgi:hypothetical protein
VVSVDLPKEDNMKPCQREARFLDAWKRGVQMAGENYFRLKAPTVEAAMHKHQLAPDCELIEASLGARSRGQAAFLAAMCSFYDAEWGQRLLVRAGYPNLCDLASKLDPPYAEIIAELFLNYPGW